MGPSAIPTVSVILNVYKRAQNFERQLLALENQSHPVTEFLVWENGEQTIQNYLTGRPEVISVRASTNLGVWARFSVALQAKSDFIWLIDDDVIPGPRWVENALECFSKRPAVIGSRGLRFRSRHSYLLYDEFGPNNPSSISQEVDIVGHNWIFPRSWLGAFWQLYEERFDSKFAGEDIHLSFAAKKILGVPTVVPPHPRNNQDLWGEISDLSLFNGNDEAAISSNPDSLRRFELAYSHYTNIGFQPMVAQEEQRPIRAAIDSVVGKSVGKFPRVSLVLAKKLGLKKRSKSSE